MAVAEELHFGRAARRLHISQPALSHQIRKLERDLGVELLLRTSRKVELTPAGRALLDQSHKVLAAAGAALDAVDPHRGAAAERLALGFTGSAAGDILPPVLERFGAAWPAVLLELKDLTGTRYDLLRLGELDLVLGRLRPHEMPDLTVVVLLEEPRMVALRADHPLAGEADLPLAALRDEPFITQPEAANPAFRASWLEEQRRHGLPGRIAAEASSIPEYLNLVAVGRGVCLTPAASARFHPWPGIAYVPVRDIEPSTVSLAWRADALQPAHRAFIDLAVEVGRERAAAAAAQPSTTAAMSSAPWPARSAASKRASIAGASASSSPASSAASSMSRTSLATLETENDVG